LHERNVAKGFVMRRLLHERGSIHPVSYAYLLSTRYLEVCPSTTSVHRLYYRNITRGNITKNQAGEGLGSILTLKDIIQEGNLGLMEAAERFDPERSKESI
jgi:hypothetical protein